MFRAGLPPKQPKQLPRGSSPGGGGTSRRIEKVDVQLYKVAEAKLCKKLQYHPYSSSRKLHPNHSVSTQPHTKTRLHTISKNISISPRKMMEKMPDKNNLKNLSFSQNFSNFFGGGAGGGLRPSGGLLPHWKERQNFLKLSYFAKLTAVLDLLRA